MSDNNSDIVFNVPDDDSDDVNVPDDSDDDIIQYPPPPQRQRPIMTNAYLATLPDPQILAYYYGTNPQSYTPSVQAFLYNTQNERYELAQWIRTVTPQWMEDIAKQGFRDSVLPLVVIAKIVRYEYWSIPFNQLSNSESTIQDRSYRLRIAGLIIAYHVMATLIVKGIYNPFTFASLDLNDVMIGYGFRIGVPSLSYIIISIMFIIREVYMRNLLWSVRGNVRIDLTFNDTVSGNTLQTGITFTAMGPLGPLHTRIFTTLSQLVGGDLEKYDKPGWSAIPYDEIEIRVRGLDLTSKGPNPFRLVKGHGKMWENIVNGTYGTKYLEVSPRIVLIPDNGNCMNTAINCQCNPPRCRCLTVNTLQYYCIETLRHMFRNSDMLIIAVTIEGKKENYRKSSRTVVCGGLFFVNETRKVIIINEMEYANSAPHCCVYKLLPPPEDHVETFVEKFKRVSHYNKLLDILCHDQIRICPICGYEYYIKEENMHLEFHMPTGNYTCERCGLHFPDYDEYEIHVSHHCKVKLFPYKLTFAETIKGYIEPQHKTREVVYADLESCICEDGQHMNILVGWVQYSNKQTKISDKIEEFINSLELIPTAEVLVYFHNGTNYDFHFIIHTILEIFPHYVNRLSLMADSSEKIKTFSIYWKRKVIVFKDSFSFVSESLENWVESTKDSNCDFECFNKTFEDVDELERKFICKKNPFPYKAIKSEEDLKLGIVQLKMWMIAENSEELFCYKFTKEELREMSEEWFRLLQHYFPGINTLKDYYILYLKCDVSQLADCMEHFAKAVREEYGLDLHDYQGIPSLTWAAWLKQNKYELEQIPEGAFDIINSSIRGGQCGAMRRYFNAETNEEDAKSLCCDLDCNALYATVMMKFSYPCHHWREIPMLSYYGNCELLDVLKELHSYGESGFIKVKMDVRRKEEIFSYVPVASKRILKDCYSHIHYLHESAKINDLSVDDMSFCGLVNVTGLHDHYCCHTKLLEFYIEHDFVRILDVYKLWVAKDEPVFEEYVKNNLEQRKKFAKDPIKKSLYKLMNNSLYGKTYEDITKRRSIKIIHAEQYKTLPFYAIRKELYKIGDFVIYEEPICEYTLDKPFYLGAAITEFSKLWMYKFFYDDIRPLFPNSEVFYTDTDALTIYFNDPEVQTFMDLAKILNEDRQILDTSNWDNVKELPEKWTKHNNEPGLFKSETGDHKIVKMVALRAKSYIMICDNGDVKSSLKGCPKKEKEKMTFKYFEDVLFNRTPKRYIQYEAIVSRHHIVSSSVLTRVVLSNDDRKRDILDDGIHTIPLNFDY